MWLSLLNPTTYIGFRFSIRENGNLLTLMYKGLYTKQPGEGLNSTLYNKRGS
jgi:hypothetical protein